MLNVRVVMRCYHCECGAQPNHTTIMQYRRTNEQRHTFNFLHQQRDGQTSLHHHSKRKFKVMSSPASSLHIHFQQNALALGQIEKVAGINDNNDRRAGGGWTLEILFYLHCRHTHRKQMQRDRHTECHYMSPTQWCWWWLSNYNARNILCKKKNHDDLIAPSKLWIVA